MSKVLVTGGAGYIGTVLVPKLVSAGYEVRIFDKLYFGKNHLKDLEGKVEIVQGDIRNFDEGVLKGIDSVIHLAGLSNDPMAEYNPKANMEINAIGTKKLASSCVKRGIERFIYASSASIYDLAGRDGEKEILDEKSFVDPKMPYSLTKFMGEKDLLELSEKNNSFAPVILRQGTVYGYSPRMRFDLVVNIFVKNALIDGKLNVFQGGIQWRPLIEVGDVAEAYIMCLEAPLNKVKGEVFNLLRNNYQIIEVAEKVRYSLEKNFDKKVDILIDKFGDKRDRSYSLSGEKFEKTFNMTPKISIENAVENIAKRISNEEFGDLENPEYYNIRWLQTLSEMEKKLKEMGGSVF